MTSQIDPPSVWTHSDGAVTLHTGDCLEVMRQMPDGCVDAVVTDPPYGLSFMGKDWDHGIPGVAFWTEALRVAKPGAHLLAFGGTRTFHRLACAIEDAGWEIRDSIGFAWVYGQGFPKSHSVAGAIDKENGFPNRGRAIPTASTHLPTGKYVDEKLTTNPVDAYEPQTEEARRWSGWGTALKPAWEPIILARKPLDGTVAQNVQAHGTGAINVDGCRITTADDLNGGAYAGGTRPRSAMGLSGEAGGAGSMLEGGVERLPPEAFKQPSGRWPANLVLSHTPECKQVGTRRVKACGLGATVQESVGYEGQSLGKDSRKQGHVCVNHGDEDGMETVEVWDCTQDCPVRMLDEQSGVSSTKRNEKPSDCGGNTWGGTIQINRGARGHTDSGGASRFFYCAKASRSERTCNGTVENTHATVKPLALMRWLCRLITPPNGVVLDPFTGSGTTGVAAVQEGFRFIGIEQDESYVEIAKARIANTTKQLPLPTESVSKSAPKETKDDRQVSLFDDPKT